MINIITININGITAKSVPISSDEKFVFSTPEQIVIVCSERPSVLMARVFRVNDNPTM